MISVVKKLASAVHLGLRGGPSVRAPGQERVVRRGGLGTWAIVLLGLAMQAAQGLAQEPSAVFSQPGADGDPNFVSLTSSASAASAVRADADAQTDRALLPPAAPPSESAGEPDVLPGLPRPADQPASLYMQPVPCYGCAPLPGPYIDGDPLLDPPSLPQPGWFSDVEVGVLLPHVSSDLHQAVKVGGGPSHVVAVPSAHFNWTASPRIELGYRLPEGIGDFSLTYRFLGSQGTGVTQGLDAPAALTSRLALHVADLDYSSNELSIGSWWLKWHLGLRGASFLWDSHANEPLAAAAAGSGIFEQSVSNNFWGVGGHYALDAERRVQDWGLSILGRAEVAALLGEVYQNFSERAIAGTSGQVFTSNPVGVPTINFNLGMAYRPPSDQRWRFFLGYQFEYWWNLGRNSRQFVDAPLVLYTTGVLLRADFNY